MSKHAVLIDGKPVDMGSVEVGGVNPSDYPDFCDAYIDAAAFEDGTPLNDAQIDQLYAVYPELAWERATERCQGE